MNRILINQVIGKELRSREQAQNLSKFIPSDRKVVVDFTGISYASRSFADEFFNLFLKPRNRVTVENANSNVNVVLLAVSITQNKKKEKSSVDILKFKNDEELTSFLLAL